MSTEQIKIIAPLATTLLAGLFLILNSILNKLLDEPFNKSKTNKVRKIIMALIILTVVGLIISIVASVFAWTSNAMNSATPTTTSTLTPTSTSTQVQITEVPTKTATASVNPNVSSITDWPLGSLIFQEDFEKIPVMKGWEMNGGSFQWVSDTDGNHIWQTSTNSQTIFKLPISINNYALEARIKQESGGQALPGLRIRIEKGNPCDSDYSTYFDTSLGWLALIDFGLTTSGTCDELQVGGTGFKEAKRYPFSKGVWYKLKIEAKGDEIRVYLNDQFMLHATSNTLNSNLIGFGAYSGGDPFVIDFDDIKVWSLTP